MGSKPALQAECIRLRTEERLSYNEIRAQTGASKSSLSKWLKDLPLTQEERRSKMSTQGGARPKERGGDAWTAEVVRGRTLSTLQKGSIAEAAVLFRLTLRGVSAYKSPFDGDKLDWVVRAPIGLVKVQVRAVCQPTKAGLPYVHLMCSDGSRKRKRYERDAFDFIVGYDVRTDLCYVWSWDEVAAHRHSVSITPDAMERWDKILGE
jgi:hypothetical protein